MSSPRVEPDTTFPLRRNALGYRYRTSRRNSRQRIQLLTVALLAFALILALTL